MPPCFATRKTSRALLKGYNLYPRPLTRVTRCRILGTSAFDCTLRGPFAKQCLTRFTASRALCVVLDGFISASTVLMKVVYHPFARLSIVFLRKLMWGQILPPHQAYYLCLLRIFAGLSFSLLAFFVQHVARHNNARISNKGHNARTEGVVRYVVHACKGSDDTCIISSVRFIS